MSLYTIDTQYTLAEREIDRFFFFFNFVTIKRIIRLYDHGADPYQELLCHHI